jgi:RNA polymerase sporulation-specific sigma factor
LGYISGQQSFKKPLSAKEEREALLKMSEGDEEARHRLIEHNMRLVVHIARKYKVLGSTFDDLISIGSVGLIKAVRSFDMHTGTPLSTYAARCIEKTILSYWLVLKMLMEGKASVLRSLAFGMYGNGLMMDCS